MSKNYCEKEIMVFKGIIKLMSEGVKLSSVKVSDIAIAAGIGKGTIYDYFKSKEEIMGKSMLYAMELELICGLEKMNEQNGFKNKCYTALKIIEESVNDHNSTSRLLLSNITVQEISEFLKENYSLLEERKLIITEAMEKLAELGVEEEVIKRQKDKEYLHEAFMSIAMGFSNTICNNQNKSQEELQRVKDRAYKMLLKILN